MLREQEAAYARGEFAYAPGYSVWNGREEAAFAGGDFAYPSGFGNDPPCAPSPNLRVKSSSNSHPL